MVIAALTVNHKKIPIIINANENNLLIPKIISLTIVLK